MDGAAGTGWSGYCAGHLDLGKEFDALDLHQEHSDWAFNGAVPKEHPMKIKVCEIVYPIFRCPTADIPEHVSDCSEMGWIVPDRVPCTYLGVWLGALGRRSYGCDHRWKQDRPIHQPHPEDRL